MKDKIKWENYKIDYERRLVSVIHDLQMRDQQYLEWSTVSQVMSGGIRTDCDDNLIKNRFKQMIWRYIQIISHINTEIDGNNEWPLFSKIAEIDLKLLCDRITYLRIQELKMKFT